MKNREPDKITNIGTKFWFDEDGEYHNENGEPAIISSKASKHWYKHGVFHNENGPAIIWADGGKFWYIDGVEYTEVEFLQHKIKKFIDE